jgi:hypothetical protein
MTVPALVRPSSGSATMVLSGQAGAPRAMREARPSPARCRPPVPGPRGRIVAGQRQHSASKVASERTTRGMRFGMVSDERVVDHGSLARSPLGPAGWRGRSGQQGWQGSRVPRVREGPQMGLLFHPTPPALAAATISKMPVKPLPPPRPTARVSPFRTTKTLTE